ncbi:MAG: exodeoxyribonuclease VII small subunit [Deltaproteobacteria bacterium]|nr:exodeoxyribonuclease VII small subunit [Deltaproteobacteria bacterium]
MDFRPRSEEAGASCPPPESFESLLDRLTQIVRELESGEIPLERALMLFEEGVRLAREGKERLDRAEARIEELLGQSLRPINPGELQSDLSRPTRGAPTADRE